MKKEDLLIDFAFRLKQDGFIVFVPEEVREAYSQGTFYLADPLGEHPDSPGSENRLREFVKGHASNRIIGGKSNIAEEDICPRLQSDYSSEEWEYLMEMFGIAGVGKLDAKEDIVISGRNESIIFASYIPLEFKSAWREHCVGRRSLHVVGAKFSASCGLPPDHFNLIACGIFDGGILVCKKFFEASDVSALREKIADMLTELGPMDVIRIAGELGIL